MYDNEYPNNYESAGTTYTSQNGTQTSPMPQMNQNPVTGTHNGKKPRKQGSGFGKKAAISICLGLFFGVCAALGFQAVNSTVGILKAVVGEENGTEAVTTTATSQITAAAETDSTVTGSTAANNEVTTVVTDVTGVVEKAMPSLVAVTNNYTETVSYFGQSATSEGSSSGTGIIVGQNDTELLVVTNYHIVEGADTLSVQFVDENTVEAQIKGTDESMDLAVIAIPLTDISADTMSSISIATLGDSDSLAVGEPAIAIGNALGSGQSVTVGVISALDRPIAVSTMSDGSATNSTETFIQTDAAINPGNSGGALLNLAGEVVGINSNKIGGSAVDSIGYAIPISAAKPIIEELQTQETKVKVDEANQGYLGISGITVGAEYAQMYQMPEGVYISQVFDNTAASAAGLVKGDVITKFEGTTIESMETLKKQLTYYETGTSVTLTVMRESTDGYIEQQISIVLGNAVDVSQ